ncbi:exodeoxyribonuclease VII large subunit [Phaeovibrio sulfidiphilus]|uniref:Exodeoxyribonuclease 7 large subunit n=1 Tax=Phaeovibrio sulfidiphilus TaxID=1220600 RepID=A0A8J6YJK1_9PROT|nr:exodeoxyribonuclease VII large subunit [Phaeovibrio sulfidiphilus]MBE1237536.1 exodeoxyribonuclease VII large subunit [Phaeovibrio sulfidiphilus]
MTDDLLAHNVPELTVSELSGALRRTVETAFSRVRVRGEISQPKCAASGHWYLRLKDDEAVIDGIIWRGQAAKLPVRPEEGMEVIATGRLTTYPGRSSYQIVIDSLELAGEGALLKLLEDRRKRLAAEGLFDAARKKPLPFLPGVVGVVTSPTGAVIRDILHRITDRFPLRVLLWPVAVQGDGAARAIVAAIEGFNSLDPAGPIPRPDVLIVARGGGSLEDLMAFNEESVVRAAAASQIPLISAVGHETDVTLIDHAADVRAPTPTGAAEIAVPVRAELVARVLGLAERLERSTTRLFGDRRERLEALARGLPRLDRLLEPLAQRLDDRGERLERVIAGLMERCGRDLADRGGRLQPGLLLRPCEAGLTRLQDLGARLDRESARGLADRQARLEALAPRLESVSHRSVLARGYALVRRVSDGTLVTSAGRAGAGEDLALVFSDGTLGVRVEGGGAPVLPSPAAARAPAGAASAGADAVMPAGPGSGVPETAPVSTPAPASAAVSAGGTVSGTVVSGGVPDAAQPAGAPAAASPARPRRSPRKGEADQRQASFLDDFE